MTRKVPPSPYIRSKMEIALAASPMLSGHLMPITLLILLPCSSTSLKKGPSPASFTKARFVAGVGTDLALVGLNYLQDMHHLMVTTNASQLKMNLLIRSQCKTGRTCWLTRRVESSQSPSWKSGKSNSLTDRNETQRDKREIENIWKRNQLEKKKRETETTNGKA